MKARTSADAAAQFVLSLIDTGVLCFDLGIQVGDRGVRLSHLGLRLPDRGLVVAGVDLKRIAF